MSDCRNNIPPYKLADVIAVLAISSTQISAARDSSGNWNIVAMGDTPGSTVNGYRPEPPRDPSPTWAA